MSQTHVIQVGGAALHSDNLQSMAEFIAQLAEDGRRIVLVHGGGRILDSIHEQLGVPVRKALGLRATTDEGLELTTMVLSGLVNKRIVAALLANGSQAMGLSGVDLGMMRSAFLNRERLGRVGGPPRIDPDPLTWLLDRGWTIVLAPICAGSDGGLVNVNADGVAQSLAVALGADQLDFVTDVDAVSGENGPLLALRARDIEPLVVSPTVVGGMVPKLQAGLAALEGGVGRIRVGSIASLARGEATEVRA